MKNGIQGGTTLKGEKKQSMFNVCYRFLERIRKYELYADDHHIL